MRAPTASSRLGASKASLTQAIFLPAASSRYRCQSSRSVVTCSGRSASRPVGPMALFEVRALGEAGAQAHRPPAPRARPRAPSACPSRESPAPDRAAAGRTCRRRPGPGSAIAARRGSVRAACRRSRLERDERSSSTSRSSPVADPLARPALALRRTPASTTSGSTSISTAAASTGETSAWLKIECSTIASSQPGSDRQPARDPDADRSATWRRSR